MSFPVAAFWWEAFEERKVSCTGFPLCRWPPKWVGRNASGGVQACSVPLGSWSLLSFRGTSFFKNHPCRHPINRAEHVDIQLLLSLPICFNWSHTVFPLIFLCCVGLTLSAASLALSCKPFMRGTCWCVESHRQLAGPGWQVWNIPAQTLTIPWFCLLFQHLLFKTVIPKNLEKEYFSGHISNKIYSQCPNSILLNWVLGCSL